MRNRKKLVRMLAGLCLAFAMIVTLSACGSSKEFSSIKEYLDAQKDEIDAAIAAQESDEMSIEVLADGDTLIYRYIYSETVPVTEEVTEYFDSRVELSKEQFSAVIEEMKELIDVKSPKVKLLYENPDGSIVYEYTFE